MVIFNAHYLNICLKRMFKLFLGKTLLAEVGFTRPFHSLSFSSQKFGYFIQTQLVRTFILGWKYIYIWMLFRYVLYFLIDAYFTRYFCRQVVVIFHSQISEAFKSLQINSPQANSRYQGPWYSSTLYTKCFWDDDQMIISFIEPFLTF